MKKKYFLLASAFIVFGFIGLLFAKFDLNDKSLISTTKQWEFSGSAIEQFEIIGGHVDVNMQFEKSRDENTYVDVEAYIPKEMTELLNNASLVNGKFSLDLTAKEKLNFFAFGNVQQEISVKVAVPDPENVEFIHIELTSGDIELNSAIAEQAILIATSGDVELENNDIKQLEVRSNSGSIDLKQHNGSVNVESQSGDVEVKQLSGSSSIISKSGKVELHNNTDADSYIETSSGDIEVSQQQEGNLTIQSHSGEVKVKLAEQYGGTLSITSDSGSINSPEQIKLVQTSPYAVKITTRSGNIKVSQ